jgi:transposase
MSERRARYTELCQRYGIARKTGYKWIERFQKDGPAGLEDSGRRPPSCAHTTPEAVLQEILKLRFQHPAWGARKLRARLEQTRGDAHWPAAGTINSILRRAGLLHARKRQRRVTPSTSPLVEITAPNQVWCMDFKGYFRCGNQERCDPFTMADCPSKICRSLCNDGVGSNSPCSCSLPPPAFLVVQDLARTASSTSG